MTHWSLDYGTDDSGLVRPATIARARVRHHYHPGVHVRPCLPCWGLNSTFEYPERNQKGRIALLSASLCTFSFTAPRCLSQGFLLQLTAVTFWKLVNNIRAQHIGFCVREYHMLVCLPLLMHSHPVVQTCPSLSCFARVTIGNIWTGPINTTHA